ncbi:MAG: thiopurine S-methyltransferase [Gammaproteobacteria bacterium]
MQSEFWHERWRSSQIGFHRDSVHPALARHFRALAAPAGGTVLVPLCGKSLDMPWIAGRGHRVLGIELSPIAVREFFAGAGLAPRVRAVEPFVEYEAEPLRVLCGDFFALGTGHAGTLACGYDRAALVALPAPMRADYARHLRSLLAGGRLLLVTVEYEQAQMQGPPFAVNESEVRALFGGGVELLERRQVLDEEPKFRERGLTALAESVYLIDIGSVQA